MRHDDDGNWTGPVGHVDPGIKLVAPAGRDPQLAADGAARHDVTAPGVMICAPALRAKSAPKSAPGVNVPGESIGAGLPAAGARPGLAARPAELTASAGPRALFARWAPHWRTPPHRQPLMRGVPLPARRSELRGTGLRASPAMESRRARRQAVSAPGARPDSAAHHMRRHRSRWTA